MRVTFFVVTKNFYFLPAQLAGERCHRQRPTAGQTVVTGVPPFPALARRSSRNVERMTEKKSGRRIGLCKTSFILDTYRALLFHLYLAQRYAPLPPPLSPPLAEMPSTSNSKNLLHRGLTCNLLHQTQNLLDRGLVSRVHYIERPTYLIADWSTAYTASNAKAV